MKLASYCSRCGIPHSPDVVCLRDNMIDIVHHPKHYRSHPSGVECITITEHMGFNLGNVIKYVWRADEKGSAIQDLEKARWYLDREIKRRTESGDTLLQNEA